MLIHVSKYSKIGKNGASGDAIRIFPLRRFFLKNKTISDFLILRFFNVLFIS